MAAKEPITAKRLRELMQYDPNTGLFMRLIATGNVHVGELAGTTRKGAGYIRVCIEDTLYYAHRLAWLYMTGEWPPGKIDHRDLNPSNNRWDNLRIATQAQNCANTFIRSHNRSGLKGVYWHKAAGKWAACVRVARRTTHLGLFNCIAAAHLSYAVAADKAFGEFARPR